MFESVYVWGFIIAVLYTLVGFWMGKNRGIQEGIGIGSSDAIDFLKDEGYIFVREHTGKDDYEIVKISEVVDLVSTLNTDEIARLKNDTRRSHN